jgi:hypothetical protein
MTNGEGPLPNWPAYLRAVREEVREGTGVFSVDDDLRTLFEECFDRGDEMTGTVLWSDGGNTRHLSCGSTSRKCSLNSACKQ